MHYIFILFENYLTSNHYCGTNVKFNIERETKCQAELVYSLIDSASRSLCFELITNWLLERHYTRKCRYKVQI